MKVENFLSAQTQINNLLRERSDELSQIKSSEEPLITRWQQLIGFVLPIQLQVIQNYGYAGDQTGLSLFNKNFMKLSESSVELKELNENKWRFLFKQAFGITEYKEMSLEKAQALIQEIAGAMTSSAFLEEVDRTFEQVDHLIPLPQRRQKLLEILLPLHMSVMSKHGFEGESGYIQVQRGLMDYYSDPLIKEAAAQAQQVVFKRAHLLD